MDLDKDSDVPQWKKDLIARLRNQNRHTSVADGGEENYGQQQQLSSGPSQPQPQPLAVQQPTPTCTDSSSESSRGGAALEKCNAATSKMVQEKAWIDNLKMVSEKYSNGVHRKDSDSDSSEDLHYGPGIVNKLKNKYLSLALRESNNRTRPSILRKAASLENILDDEVPNGNKSENRLFQGRVNGCSENAKNVPNRYRSATRGLELKRARSVEAISMSHHDENKIENNRQSLHEDMLLISEGNDKPFSKKHDKIVAETGNSDKQKYTNVGRVNRPKRVAPMMNEREKPPADVVKQKKLIFERRPETRTKPPISTGDVAAKVDTYNSIIVKAKASKKPLIKHKPVVNDKKPPAPQPRAPKIIANDDKVAKNKPKSLQVNKVPKSALMSPIPDVSRIDFPNQKGDKEKQLSETPDLILTSSPILAPGSPTFKKSTEQFLNEEIRVCSPDGNIFASPKVSPTANDNVDSPGKISKAAGTAVFNFSNAPVEQSHLPINKNVSTAKTPLEKPLKIDVNGFGHNDAKKSTQSPNEVISPTIRKAKLESPKANLTTTEIEKNLINTAKSSSASVSPPKPAASAVPEVSKNVVVPKVKRAQEPTSTTAVFNFTARKDVPDYISNDRSRTAGRPELPKTGEGGIILIPGATILDSYTDEDEELRSLEGPPSPCDVEFVNANILIDGKSSLSQKSKRSKLNISFVDSIPEIFEYPSETSLLFDEVPSPVSNSTLGHSVPNLSGSTLSNYTPKGTEDFQLGVTRSIQSSLQTVDKDETDKADLMKEAEEPIAFSAGTNSDILF